MSNKVGSACERCFHYVKFAKDIGICSYEGQCRGTQVNTPADTETPRTG